MVLLRTPGLTGKLDQSWAGPYEVIEKKGEVTVVLGIPGKRTRGKTVHVNNTKPFHQVEASVCRIVVAAEDESSLVTPSRLQGDNLSLEQQSMLDATLQKFEATMSSSPGKTTATVHEVETGDARPIRSVPFHLPPQWKDQVKVKRK